jgi:hypothetical protein
LASGSVRPHTSGCSVRYPALPISGAAFLRDTAKAALQMQDGFSGAGYEARTRYLHLGKVALYQMS